MALNDSRPWPRGSWLAPPLLVACVAWACDKAPPVGALPEQPTIDIPDWTTPGDVPRVQAVVDLRERGDGWMRVRMRYDGLTKAMGEFKEMGKDPELFWRNVRFSDEDGDAISASQDGRVWDVGLFNGGSITIDFEVKPGGDGRHGHQGWVADDWASFDGRVFLSPLGAGDLQAGRIRMEAPAGWTTASPLPKENDGWLSLGAFGPFGVQTALIGTCYGVGDFEESIQTFGKTEVREYHIKSWPAPHRKSLTRGSMAEFEWFYTALGFDPGFPLAVVWTPDVKGKRVYGGSSASGTCMEQPKGSTRAMELFAHRLAHSMNKYNPSGIHIRDEADQWFKEGWPSYIEAVATEATGNKGRVSRWSTVHKTFKRTRKEHPDRDIALKDEPSARGDTTEHLHYFKGPLVVRLLDEWLRRRHGKDLTEFMRLAWAKNGNRKAPMALREDLEAWAGVSLDDFWAVHVDQRGFVYPVGEEVLTADVTKRAAAVGIGTVGGRPVDADYLFLLVDSGEFHRFGDIVRFLEQEEPRRAFLASQGIELLPPALEAMRAGLEPQDRFDLVRSERAWPLHTSLVVPDEQRLVLDPANPRAVAFSRLLADEVAYEAALHPSGLDAMSIHVKNAEGDFKVEAHLSLPADAEVRLETQWLAAAGQMKVRARRGDTISHERTTDIWNDWTRAWSPYIVSQLPKGEGIVTFEVETTAGAKVARSYWRRGT